MTDTHLAKTNAESIEIVERALDELKANPTAHVSACEVAYVPSAPKPDQEQVA